MIESKFAALLRLLFPPDTADHAIISHLSKATGIKYTTMRSYFIGRATPSIWNADKIEDAVKDLAWGKDRDIYDWFEMIQVFDEKKGGASERDNKV